MLTSHRRDRSPPWESGSPWNILNRKIDDFIDLLPRDLTLAPANLNAHIVSKTSTPFFMMHAVLLLSRMMLHREYIPFIALRCGQPEGPLDPPLFPRDQYHVPPTFWEQSAVELFRSARTLVDLAHTCHEWKVLPQTPMVGFAIYVAANTGMFVFEKRSEIPCLQMTQESTLSTSHGWIQTATCVEALPTPAEETTQGRQHPATLSHSSRT